MQSRLHSPQVVSYDPPLAHEDSTPVDVPKLLTAREAAAVLAVSEKTLQHLTAPKGTLPVVRIGKRGVRYTTAALQKWIGDQQTASLRAPEQRSA